MVISPTLFTTFADLEARGVSPLYERLAREVAARPALLDLLAAAPRPQRRATLLFAAVHDLVLALDGSYPADGPSLESFCRAHRDALIDRIANRRTQTNEVARSAQLVPAFALISALAGWPLSLLEVGASAGLNLRFDSYRFVYRSRDVLISVGDDRSPVRVDGEFEGDTRAIPESMPPIAKRVGLDIDPIDLGDPLQVRWLRACVWADAVDRDRRLQAAISLAQAEPPVVLRGDASVDLERVAAGLAPDVPLVVMHQAVMTYLSASARHRVRAAIRGLACRRPVFWLLSEDPAIAQMLTGVDTSSITTGAHHVLVLTDFTRDVPASAVLAHADPHGRWLRWLAPAYDGDLSRLFKGP